MRNSELVNAFIHRMNGETWGTIGKRLNYSGANVRAQIYRALDGQRPCKALQSESAPALADYIIRQCNGFVTQFAHETGVSATTITRLLRGGKPAPETAAKIRAVAGDVI